MLNIKTVEYIIGFLLGAGNESYCKYVAYGSYASKNVRIKIETSSFWEYYLTDNSMPQLPCKTIHGVPVLFGDVNIQKEEQCILTDVDIIASSFFLLTRYEECINRIDRDEHGRFPASASLPYRAGFLHRPIVDEYGKMLREWLRMTGVSVVEPEPHFEKVYLTHDVDMPWSEFSSIWYCIRSAAKDVLIHHCSPLPILRKYIETKKTDPFLKALDWLREEDEQYLKNGNGLRSSLLFFILCCDDNPHDFGYSKCSRKVKVLTEKLRVDAELGLHVSYHAGLDPNAVKYETQRFETITGAKPVMSRYHFLACREPEDLHSLIDAGVRDDFSHAYAAESGFRLGTCRPVRWIDPINMELTPLTLHPMTIMECTLDMKEYMGLDEEAAYTKCRELIEQVMKYNGEVILLWHNTSVLNDNTGYQKRLYRRILDYLTNGNYLSSASI